MIVDKAIAESISLSTKSGYWSVGTCYFFDKAECFKYATRTGQHTNIKFHFYDSVYGSIDWTKDCSKSLVEVYVDRAKQIRDTYDYVVLAYSGGSDSANVLDSFLSNNVKIDEIVSYCPLKVVEKLMPSFDPNNKEAENLIFEYVLACQPVLKKISNEYPNIKITLLDYTDNAIDIVNNSNAHLLSMGGQSISVVLAGHRALAVRLKEISEKFEKVCCVTGIEKPKILYRPSIGKFATYFPDLAYLFGKTSIDGYMPVFEHFYHDPDGPTIAHAQTTALKKALTPIFSNPLDPLKKSLTLKTSPNGDLILDNESEFFKKIIYKNYNPTVWQTKKTTSWFYQSSCSWAHSTLVDQRTRDFFDGQLKEFLSGIHPSLIVYENRVPAKFKDCFSTMYWL